MVTGTVKFFNNDKGFGFITPETGGTDVFVHVSAVRGGQLNEGDTVSYEIGQDRKNRQIASRKRQRDVSRVAGCDGGHSDPAWMMLLMLMQMVVAVPGLAVSARCCEAKKPTAMLATRRKWNQVGKRLCAFAQQKPDLDASPYKLRPVLASGQRRSSPILGSI